jgi:hypothetical protein
MARQAAQRRSFHFMIEYSREYRSTSIGNIAQSPCHQSTRLYADREMILAKGLLNGMERFLAILPPKTCTRGRDYFARGDVLSVTCVESNHRYSAVVRGGEDYKVELSFADNIWLTKCSCPMNYDCKHVVAAMLELERLAGEDGNIGARKPKTPSRNPDQFSNSPLADRLTAALGRKLRQPELNFVRQIQSLYQVARYRQLTERDLGTINPQWYFSYQPLNLWPEFPSDDFYCWLFIAWELRRGEVPYPDFMEAITDFSLIEKEIIQWQRDKEIDRWKGWFQGFEPGAPQADAGTLDLRLMILSKEARLQWRTDAASEFLDLKQSQAKRFAEQFESGSLQVTPEALPLWSAVFKPWNYESWWSFKYENSTSRPALNRLLRMPLRGSPNHYAFVSVRRKKGTTITNLPWPQRMTRPCRKFSARSPAIRPCM